MTVREAFSKAFGPVPEGATCHVGSTVQYEGSSIEPTILVDGFIHRPDWNIPNVWSRYEYADEVEDPDISDRPASSFLGFFSESYDAVVNGVQP